MSGLPTGWVEDEASTICELVQSGGTPKEGFIDQPGVPFLKVYNIVDQKIDFEYKPQFIDVAIHRSSMAKSQAFPGDVLMNIVGPPLGKVAVIQESFPTWNVNQALTIFRPSKALTSEWLYYFLCGGDSVKSVINETRGSAGQVNISLSQCRAFKLRLPPLAEQKRIVAKLDALNAKSARARTELTRIETLVSRYKQAVLSKAFSGELTREWRLEHGAHAGGDELRAELISKYASLQKKHSELDFSGSDILGELPSSWTWMPVAGLATKVVDGVHKKPNYIDSGVPFVTVENLTAGPGLSFEGCRFISIEDHKEFTKRTNPEEGDILISKDGTLGVVRAVRTAREFSIFVSVALVKLIDRSMTDYLEFALISPIMQGQMGGVGTGLQHIHLTDLRRDFVPVAPRQEQHEIVSRIKSAFAKIDRLAIEARRALKLLGKLDEAILAKAFRGELVPQDENDEPAEILLERIRTERKAAPKAKRGRGAKA